VFVGDPLVAEVLGQLVDALQAANDQALQVELGRDAQVEVAVQRVVVRCERARERAAKQNDLGEMYTLARSRCGPTA
jgi:hypothetical protein